MIRSVLLILLLVVLGYSFFILTGVALLLGIAVSSSWSIHWEYVLPITILGLITSYVVARNFHRLSLGESVSQLSRKSALAHVIVALLIVGVFLVFR